MGEAGRARRSLLVANAEVDDDALATAVDVLTDGGVEVEVVRTGSVDDVDPALAERDGREVTVAGGDGTLHCVVDQLRRRGELGSVDLGLLPFGTGNDFARSLGISGDPAAAARTVLDGSLRSIDCLATDWDDTVVNVAHAGIGAEAARTGEQWKSSLGGLAYRIGALLEGVRVEAADLRVTVDGTTLGEGPTLMVGIANGAAFGAGAALAPDARPDDGIVEVVVLSPDSLLDRAALALALEQGEHLERDDVRTATGRVVEIEGEPVRHNVDGEVSDPRDAARYEVLASAYRLRVPTDGSEGVAP